MIKLKGTKTEKNLMEAFANESKSRNLYTYFALQAREEGHEQIAAIFEETSNNEREHAKLWYKLLCEKEIPPTIENLRTAISKENTEWTEMYKHMAADARAEGYNDIAFLFDSVGAIEMKHEARYRKLLEGFEGKSSSTKTEKSVWICRSCGYIADNEKAPPICPVCNHSQMSFELRIVNY